jgi:hypothetical protein
MSRDPKHAAGAGDRLVALGAVVFGDGAARLDSFELMCSRRRIELRSRDRSLCQDGDNVFANLRKPAVDEVALDMITLVRAQLAKSQPADEWRPPR